MLRVLGDIPTRSPNADLIITTITSIPIKSHVVLVSLLEQEIVEKLVKAVIVGFGIEIK